MSSAIVPIPRVPVNVRVATMDDLPFMDGLQKKYGKALGYFPRKQFEGYIGGGDVLVAEDGTQSGEETQSAERRTRNEEGANEASPSFCVPRSSFRASAPP